MEKIELKTVEEKQAACIFHAIPVTSVGEDMGALLRQIFEWEVKKQPSDGRAAVLCILQQSGRDAARRIEI